MRVQRDVVFVGHEHNRISLTEQQLEYLSKEGKPTNKTYTTQDLVEAFNKQVDNALLQLSQANADTLTDFRLVGRGKLPSTVIGLYTHSAEHTMRHLGQLIVTVRVLRDSSER